MGPTVPSNVIAAVSYASLGYATDFGDLTVARLGLSSMQSPTRAVFAGGGSPANVIDTIIFSSAGNATDFGDISNPPSPVDYFGGSSTETRGLAVRLRVPVRPTTGPAVSTARNIQDNQRLWRRASAD